MHARIVRGAVARVWVAILLDAEQLCLDATEVERAPRRLTSRLRRRFVEWDHLATADHNLADAIAGEFYRFEPFLRRSVQAFVREHFPQYVADERGDKEFFCSFYDLPSVEKIRGLRTDRVGRLVSISGIVTRSSEVRPELMFGCFTCGECGTAFGRFSSPRRH